MTGVHRRLTLKSGLAFRYYKISQMGWIPRTKMKTMTMTFDGGSGIRDGLASRERHSRLGSLPPFHSPYPLNHPLQCPPLSNHLPHITFVHQYSRTRNSSIVSFIRRVDRILGGRIGYLRRLSVFEVLDGEQDVNVFPLLCQRGVWGWGCANPTSTGITTECRFK